MPVSKEDIDRLKVAQKCLLCQLEEECHRGLELLPAICYALNEKIMPPEVVDVFERNGLKAVFETGTYNACYEKQGYFYIILLYFVLCYYTKSRGDDYRKVADERMSQSEWSECLDKNLQYIGRWKKEKEDEFEQWLKAQCWVLSCDEGRGTTSRMLFVNQAVYCSLQREMGDEMPPLETLVMDESVMKDHLDGIDDDLFYSSVEGDISPYLQKIWASPIHRTAYLCSLKALSSTNEEAPEALSQSPRWNWLTRLWGKAAGKMLSRPVMFRWVFVKGERTIRLMVDSPADKLMRGRFCQDGGDRQTPCEEVDWVYDVSYFEEAGFDLHKPIKLKVENSRDEYEISPLYPSAGHQFVFFRRRPMEGGCSKLYNGNSARSFCLVYPGNMPCEPRLAEEAGVCKCVEKSVDCGKWSYAVYDLPVGEHRAVEVQVQDFKISLSKPSKLFAYYDQEVFVSGRNAIVVTGTELPVVIDGSIKLPDGLSREDGEEVQKIRLDCSRGGEFYRIYRVAGASVLFLPGLRREPEQLSGRQLAEAVAYARKGMESYHLQVRNESGTEEDCILTRARVTPLWVWENKGRFSTDTKTFEQSENCSLRCYPMHWNGILEVKWLNHSTGRSGAVAVEPSRAVVYAPGDFLRELAEKRCLTSGDEYSLSFGENVLLKDKWSPLHLEGKKLTFPERYRKYWLCIRHELYYRCVVRNFIGVKADQGTYEFMERLDRMATVANSVDLTGVMERITREDGYWVVALLQNKDDKIKHPLYIEPTGGEILGRWNLPQNHECVAGILSRNADLSEFGEVPKIREVLKAATAILQSGAAEEVLELVYSENHQLRDFLVKSTCLLKAGFAATGNAMPTVRELLPIGGLFPLNTAPRHEFLQAVTLVNAANGRRNVEYWKADAFQENRAGVMQRRDYAFPYQSIAFSMENFHVEQLPRIAGTSGRNSSDKVKELAGCIVTWLAVGAGNAQNGLDAALASDAASRSIGCLYDFPNGQAAIQHIQNSIRAGRPYAVCSLPQLLHALIFSMEAEGTTGKHCAHFFLCAIELLRVIKAKGGKEQQGTIAYALERVKETDCRPLRTGIAKCLFLLLWLDAFFSTR